MHKRIFFVLLILFVTGTLVAIKQLKVYEDITQTLPKSEVFKKLGQLIDHKGINSSIYFSIRPQTTLDSEDLHEIGKQFKQDLETECGNDIINIRYELQDDELTLYDYISLNLPFYLDENDYTTIENKLVDDSVAVKLIENHQLLFTPEGFLMKHFLMSDPLGIDGLGLSKFSTLQSASNFVVNDGLLLLPDNKSLFIMAELTQPTNDAGYNKILANKIERVTNKWNTDYSVDYFSSFLIAHANTTQVKKDTLLTLWLSLTAILLLLLIYYRSLLLPVFFVIPGIIGILFSIALIAVTKGEISAIAMGAGAIVLGIIMDYSFHFFTHLKHSASVEETLKDVSHPLLIGCFTTILAFLSLTFTNSPVLHDFGYFASLSLIGAAISVLFILPVLLPAYLEKKWKAQPEKQFRINFNKPLKYLAFIAILAFTIIALIYAPKIEFDDELTNLSYYPEALKKSEIKFNGIDPDNEKRIFILSESYEKENAQQVNFAVFQSLQKLKEEGLIKDYLNTSLFDVPEKEKQDKLIKWNSFWEKQSKKVSHQLDSMTIVLGYYENAFDSFKKKINGTYQVQPSPTPKIATDLNKLIDSTGGNWSYLSYFTVEKSHKDSVVQFLRNTNPEASVVDRSEIAGSLIQTVQDDFNFILLASSLLVFVSLLIVYGRIELALITFLPMILSWIWILGIAVLLGIKFNFVNIIISTFIFGLGDDFAIFITDGFVSKYAKNKNVINSYKTGILLSAATTIIGTGVLIFAVHPAIHSIALISVVGMISILIISFTVQPYLLRKMLVERKEKGLPPVSLVNLIVSVVCFTFFISGCLVLFPLQLIFRIIPFGQKQLKYVYHLMMQWFSWAQVYFMINFRKKVNNRELLDFKRPSIIIANHQSFVDLVMILSLHPKIIIMTNDWVYRSPLFGSQIKYLGFFPGSSGVEKNLEAIRPWVKNGYSVVIFPEGTRSKDKTIGRFHKGAFYLAQELDLDITPIMLHGFNDAMRKHDYILLNGKTSVTVLPRISKDDVSYGTTYRERCKSISSYFKKSFKEFDLTNSDSSYLQHKIISNYIFKSPFIEWYIKIKWLFEKKNFDQYHQIVPLSGKIYDLGCGYGYLSYYLHYRSNERSLIGIDYDEDKIEIAENCYSKNTHINFAAADIREIEMDNAAAIFLNDVVHYLPEKDHELILQKCLSAINPNGVLMIRDGVTDLTDRHKKTELTEKYSTKIVRFNKTKNNLCFFSKDFIVTFAKKNNLSCEIIEQPNKMSNTLFVLKKN